MTLSGNYWKRRQGLRTESGIAFSQFFKDNFQLRNMAFIQSEMFILQVRN